MRAFFECDNLSVPFNHNNLLIFMPNEFKGLDTLPPKTAFTVGLVGGVLGMCTLGFFVLLATVARANNTGGSFFNLKNNAVVAANTNTNPSPVPTPTVTDPTTTPTTAPPVVTDNDHLRGDVNAPITMITYSDYECPYCKSFHATMLQVMDAYKGQVKWVYRHFPLSFHANAQKQAEAAECAAELGGNEAFWTFSDKVFERTTSNGTGFALEALVPLAKEIGLNETEFKTCLDSGKYAAKVQAEEDAGAAAGITGTPGTFVVTADGKSQLIPGALPLTSITQIIDSVK